MATYGEWNESLGDENLLREVVGDDNNDRKRKTKRITPVDGWNVLHVHFHSR